MTQAMASQVFRVEYTTYDPYKEFLRLPCRDECRVDVTIMFASEESRMKHMKDRSVLKDYIQKEYMRRGEIIVSLVPTVNGNPVLYFD
jgi:hypothetical protein